MIKQQLDKEDNNSISRSGARLNCLRTLHSLSNVDE